MGSETIIVKQVCVTDVLFANSTLDSDSPQIQRACVQGFV